MSAYNYWNISVGAQHNGASAQICNATPPLKEARSNVIGSAVRSPFPQDDSRHSTSRPNTRPHLTTPIESPLIHLRFNPTKH